MSAIRTHEFFDIVDGDMIEFENDDGPQSLRVKTIMISRQNPTVCQLFASAENTGSLTSRQTKVYHGQISSFTTLNSTKTDFSVKAKIGDEFKSLELRTTKSNSSGCCIS